MLFMIMIGKKESEKKKVKEQNAAADLVDDKSAPKLLTPEEIKDLEKLEKIKCLKK
jgi:hypothetical protein